RIILDWPLPLIVGDRLLLRDPARRHVLGGVGVLDPDPPRLLRRGDGTRLGVVLAAMPPGGDVLAKGAGRGAAEVDYLHRIGLVGPSAAPPPEVRELSGWWVHLPTYNEWRLQLRALVENDAQRDQLTPGVSQGAVRESLGTPAAHFIDQLVADA